MCVVAQARLLTQDVSSYLSPYNLKTSCHFIQTSTTTIGSLDVSNNLLAAHLANHVGNHGVAADVLHLLLPTIPTTICLIAGCAMGPKKEEKH
jgi:hypothetical protein